MSRRGSILIFTVVALLSFSFAEGQATDVLVGTVFPLAEIPIITQSGGRVVSVATQEGEPLRRGQRILALDASRPAGEIRLLELQVKNRAALRLEDLALMAARRDLARDEALFRDQAVPPKTLEDSRHRAKLAAERVAIERGRIEEQRQTLALRRKALEDFLVNAPADGIIDTLLVYPNQVVSSGAKVGNLLRIDQVLVEAFVPLARARRFKVGGRAVITGDDIAKVVGRINLIGQKVDPVSGSIKVRVAVPNGTHILKPGMLVRISL